MKLKRILCAACISLIGLQALAGEVDDNLKKLETALQKSAKEQETKGAPENELKANLFLNTETLPRLRGCISEGNLHGAIEILQQFNNFSIPEETRKNSQKAADDLLATLRKDQETRGIAAAAKIEETLKHAADVVKKAKAAPDLDAVLQELASVKNSADSRRYAEQTQTARSKVEPTYRFVARWQEYLAAQAAGNSENCRSILRDLANSDTLLIPRSELLAKAQEPKNSVEDAAKPERSVDEIADEMIAKTKSLNNISELVKELRRLNNQRRSGNYDRSDLQSTIQTLDRMDRSYQEFQAGLGTNIDVATNSNPTPTSLIPLKNQLLLLVLPRYITAPPHIKPKASEGVVEFLNRVAAEAKAAGDMALASRSKEALRQMQRSSSYTSGDTAALSNFQAAQNQEIAGQYMLAVVSYQTALKSGSDTVPAKLIGERLADIKKNHPEEFEKGMERFLTPPPVQMANPMMNRYPVGMPGFPGRPDITPTPTPTPEPPKLVIPPPTPAPAKAEKTHATSPAK